MPENCVVKCVYRPRRVPGSRQVVARLRPTSAIPAAGGRTVPGGASRSATSTRTAASTPVAAAPENVAVHDVPCSSATNG